ncbi:DNA repair protein rad16 [Neolecta irregularis DAH-3]|uniref:DNA repair protein rad16 n=1 Tax=Neolecta irregularis (strain DAH-3) TaxID=1198029 RepID=A0A1U7LTB7_NEOID|nr:DNA repair protein rad16 [Neolecta irregularis DAH-3]|eukprot:OLL25916.1 DNA repair protein rad16 [Neolecta irregularis DAH-3]
MSNALAAEHEDIRLSLPLEYQKQILRDVRTEDGLVILARGLGLPRIISNLLHSYDRPGNLVVLLGAHSREEDWIGESMASIASATDVATKGLQILNTELTGVEKREKLYAQGGMFSITSRILVTDLLTKLLDPVKITGIVIIRAERVVATSTEAFILRIFRQNNKVGFIKAFSDNPEPFTTGFSPLSNMMRHLFLRKVYLWPRYRLEVAKSLENRRAEVIELEVNITESMRDIQNAILECIEVCLAELKRSNSQVDFEEWNIESALQSGFEASIRRVLDPVWHRVSKKTRQIVSDLTTLQQILHYLLTYDSVSFNKVLDAILATNTPAPGSTRQNHSPWLFLDAANIIFSTAKRRIFGSLENKTETLSNQISESEGLEELPKWSMLAEVIDEIEHELHFNPPSPDSANNTILLMCSDGRTCRQVRQFLQNMQPTENGKPANAKTMMRRKLKAYREWKPNFVKIKDQLFRHEESTVKQGIHGHQNYDHRGKPPPNKRRRVRGGGTIAAASSTHPINIRNTAICMEDGEATRLDDFLGNDDIVAKEEVAVDLLEHIEDFFELYDYDELVVILPYDGDMDDRALEELRPRFIVMYEPEPSFIRRVEVYRSSHQNRSLRVYYMYYGSSVEEQRYLSAVRREKDAFTRLIREKGNMAIVLTQDGASMDDPQNIFLRTINTRIAGGGRITAASEPPRVCVDLREFRSSLPSLLHGRNLTIVPCMLTVGDYIISPTMCIERKSVKDLISSFRDGRLYTQCETMLLHYKTPLLLIEFDQNKTDKKPFADMTSSIGSTDLQTKLVLLTLAFPRIKIIWSSSPYATAEIFEELKKNHDEPNPVKAVSIGLEEGEEPTNSYNQAPQDFLRSMPAISSKNYKNLMLEVENLRTLSNMSQRQIQNIVGLEAGRAVYKFLNKDFRGLS